VSREDVVAAITGLTTVNGNGRDRS
jgi:hypothetical protein